MFRERVVRALAKGVPNQAVRVHHVGSSVSGHSPRDIDILYIVKDGQADRAVEELQRLHGALPDTTESYKGNGAYTGFVSLRTADDPSLNFLIVQESLSSRDPRIQETISNGRLVWPDSPATPS